MAKLYICDECGKIIDGSELVEITVEYMHNGDGSKGSGWFCKIKKHLCPDCSQRFTKHNCFSFIYGKDKKLTTDIRTMIKQSSGGDPK